MEMFRICCYHKKKCFSDHNINIILIRAILFRTDCILFSRPGNRFGEMGSKYRSSGLCSCCHQIFPQAAKWFLLLQTFVLEHVKLFFSTNIQWK